MTELLARRDEILEECFGPVSIVVEYDGIDQLKAAIEAFEGNLTATLHAEESDAELVSRSMRALRPLLGITGEPLLSRVYRWDRANAQHEVGHLDRVAAIERALTHHPGLFVTGSGFRGTGIPDCVADGRATGKQLAEWLRA